MFMSLKFSDSSYGIKNALLVGLLRLPTGKVWAVEGFNVYSKKRVCVNLSELEYFNGKEDTMTLVSYALLKGF